MPISTFISSKFYTKKLSVDIDSPIAGLTANDSTKLIFSTQTPNGGVSPVYVRSTTCWAKNIDLSPLSPWNSNGGTQKAGTLISPKHILFANHFIIPNTTTLIFVDMNNNSYTRTLSNSLQVGSTDIQIGLLDSDLPSNVSFCKVASVDLSDLARFDFYNPSPTWNKIPVFYTDQQEKALIALGYGQPSAPQSYFIEPPNYLSTSQENIQRANFYELPIGGDSGSPICFVYNNKLILLFTFTSSWGGSSAPYNINAINSVMTTLGGGYTLSIFNKEDITSQEKNISIKKQNLTSLKPYSIDGGATEYDANAVYIFKGGSINTISTVFNYLELQGGSSYSTADGIYIPSLGFYVYYKNSGFGGTGWRTLAGADATNLVINNNDLIYFTPRSNKQISVGSGAIIQRYSNGKMTLKKN